MSTIRSLKVSELEELYDLMAYSFRKEKDGQEQARIWHKQSIENDPEFDPRLSRIIVENNRIVARVGIYDRKMYFNGGVLRVGAIGGVCTAPEYRGKGYLKTLLADCTEFMIKEGFDISILFGLPEIYGKSGWDTMLSFGLAVNFKLCLDSIPGSSRKIKLPDDLKKLCQLYEAFNLDLNGPFVRDESYWSLWINHKLENMNRFDVFLVESENGVDGYYVLKDKKQVSELVWNKNKSSALGSVIADIYEKLSSEFITFDFYLPEIYEFFLGNMQYPSFDEIQERSYYIRKEIIYCGLIKLLNKNNMLYGENMSTESLIRLFRQKNYISWNLDHF